MFLEDALNEKDYQEALNESAGINSILKTHHPECDAKDLYFMMEFLLWGLESFKKLNKYRTLEGFQFKDSLGSYISGL